MEVCVHIVFCCISADVVDSGAPVSLLFSNLLVHEACDERFHGGFTVARSVARRLAWVILLCRGWTQLVDAWMVVCHGWSDGSLEFWWRSRVRDKLVVVVEPKWP